ncbi:MAG: GIY-YIG nuclease family protein [Bdellovibrionota bacterium]
MKYVYILRSIKWPERRYFGITSDLKTRLKHHNDGCSRYTKRYRPWKLDTYIGFSDEERATEFERYLKTGSGKAFSKKRL